MPTSIPSHPARRVRDPVRRARRAAFVALGLLLLVCGAGAGFWYFVAGRVQADIDAGLAREAENGRKLTCAAREVFGFPFRIAMRCDAPRLEVEGPAGKIALTAARLTGVAQIYDLNHVIVEAMGPLSVEAPGVSDTEADWRSFLVSFVATGGVLDHADMAVEGPSLHMREGQNMLASQAERFELHVRRDPARPREDDAVELSGRLVRLASPRLDAFMGEASPADADVDASISKVAALQPQRPEASPLPIERWRLAGGALHVAAANLAKGSFKASVAGELQLDEMHRVLGRLDTSVEGAEALVSRLGLPPAAASFLKMSGGKLRLPLVMSNGRMAIGPISVARLIPLY